MSLFAACWWSVLRDLLIALLAMPLCLLLVRFLRSASCDGRETLVSNRQHQPASHGVQPVGFGSRSPKLLVCALSLRV